MLGKGQQAQCFGDRHRIFGDIAVGIEAAIDIQHVALSRRHFDVHERNNRRRLIPHNRIGALTRAGKGHWIGTENRFVTAVGDDQFQRIDHSDRDQAFIGKRHRVKTQRREVMAIGAGISRNALLTRYVDQLLARRLHCDLEIAIVSVPAQHARCHTCHRRLRGRVCIATLKALFVDGQHPQAMAARPVAL